MILGPLLGPDRLADDERPRGLSAPRPDAPPASWDPVIPASGQAKRALAAMPPGPRRATLAPAERTGEREFG
jgi:hypothetical protein